MYKIFLISVLLFSGLICACSYQKIDRTFMYLDVSPKKEKCEGEGIQDCLMVKEFYYDKTGSKVYKNKDWVFFYDDITGYTHNENLRESLKVKVIKVINSDADASDMRYKLIEKINN